MNRARQVIFFVEYAEINNLIEVRRLYISLPTVMLY